VRAGTETALAGLNVMSEWNMERKEKAVAKYADKSREMRCRLNVLANEFLKMKKSLAKIEKEMRRLRSAAGLGADAMLTACERIDWQEFVKGLSIRSTNVLHLNGIVDAASLASLTIERLCGFKYCGETTVREIEGRLAEFGVDLPAE
jgi:DNA-directed RNA polymerase alpha subunit